MDEERERIQDAGEDDIDSSDAGSVNTARGLFSAVTGGVIGAAKAGLDGLKQGVSSVGGRVSRMASGSVDATSRFFNVSKKTGAATLVFSTLFLLAAGGFGAYSYMRMNTVIRQEATLEDVCEEEVAEFMSVSDSATVSDVSGIATDYARKAWAVGKALGMSDEQCAGMLGNMEHESGNDPTAIETLSRSTDPFNIDGPTKSSAKSDLCNFFQTYVVPMYKNSGWSIQGHTTSNGCTVAAHTGTNGRTIMSSAYDANGHYAVGIGLFQFTGVNATKLMDYAAALGRGWWELDVQLAFSIDTTNGFGAASWVHTWATSTDKPATPEEAAADWLRYFEGSTTGLALEQRSAKARRWYDMFKGTNGDESYAGSVLALVNTTSGSALASVAQDLLDECATEAEPTYDNNTIAAAAVSYAYATEDEGRGNNGTSLYQQLHAAIFPTSSLYMSCDIGAATAIVWSGADDNFPPHASADQEVHMLAYPDKWQDLGYLGGDVMHEDLQPGDVLVIRGGGHIVLYVGNEAVQAKYPGNDAELVSASYGERSPGCGKWWDSVMYEDYPMYRGQYHVFRNIKKEVNPQYVDCIPGVAPGE